MARASKGARQRKKTAEGVFGAHNSRAEFEKNYRFHKSNGLTKKAWRFLSRHQQRLEGKG